MLTLIMYTFAVCAELYSVTYSLCKFKQKY